MREDAFSILHDGEINEITGKCPETVTLTVRCDYLRENFSTPGEYFYLKLQNCSEFLYLDKNEIKSSANELFINKKISIIILSAEDKNGIVTVYTADGQLRLQYESLTVWLNDKTPLPVQDLERVAEEYWDEWKDESRINS